MGFQVSPGVNVTEIDLTTIIPAVSTTEGGIAGLFEWGPVEDRELVTSEDELVLRYGKPTSGNFETWLTASSFLAYGNKLFVSRAAANTVKNAVAFGPASSPVGTATLIKNKKHYDEQAATLPANSNFYAKYPGALGNSLKISVCATPTQYRSKVFTSNTGTELSLTYVVGSNTATISATSNTNDNTAVNTHLTTALASLSVGDYLVAGNTSVGQQYVKITSKTAAFANGSGTSTAQLKFETRYSLSDNVTVKSASLSNSGIVRYWEYYDVVDGGPKTSQYVTTRHAQGANALDELHLVIIDAGGKFSGIPGTILEVWQNLSRASDALGEQGGTIYYKNILNEGSRYVWASNDVSTMPTGTSTSIADISSTVPYYDKFTGGAQSETESSVPLNALARAYDQFLSTEEVDISLILQGKARGGVHGEQLANYIIDNICEVRKDCVLTVSPDIGDVVNNGFDVLEDMVDFRNVLRSSSYFVLDSGYKYMYDRYNDVYRWVPLNGDIAGLMVRTDETRDAWWSPGGFTRGNIKNVIKLAFNPNKAERDILYKNSINPVVSFPGQGVILYGDKTGLARPSAFDRINVRRLFIVLEKAISTAAKFTLFEFNDEFTRAQFRNMVEPYLRDVQGRRGIYEFKVVCNETNNTPEVIDSNRFIGDIYIKPARSINFIQLNFIAVRTGVEFEEVVGRF